MKFILIFVLWHWGSNRESTTSGAIEFNDIESCQAAAIELQKKTSNMD